MRIRHVVELLDPKGGGPGIVAARLAAASAQLGHDVAIISEQPSAEAEARFEAAERGLPGSSLVERRYIAPGDLPSIVRQAVDDRSGLKKLEALFKDSDVIHLHGVWDRAILASARAATRLGIPYVVAPHGMLDPWSLSQRAMKKRVALRLVFGPMLNRANVIHALNATERDLIAPLNLVAPIEVLPNGIIEDEILPLPPRSQFREKFPQLGDRPVVLFLARLHEKKGLDILTEAFAMVVKAHPAAMLAVVGPDQGALSRLEEDVRRLGLESSIVIAGPLYGRDRIAAYAGSDIFCLPSRQEGFSVSVLEALACGLPCVVSHDTHFPDITSRHLGAETSLKPTDVAAALAALLADPAQRREIGHRASTFARAHYTWDNIAARAVEMYRRYSN